MGLSNELSCEAGSFSSCCPNPHWCFQSKVQGFTSPLWSPGPRGLPRSLPFVRFICAQMRGFRAPPTALPALLSATPSPALSVYLCANVGLQGLLVVGLPAPFVPHSASLVPATATRVLSAPPTSLDECLFFTSLVSDLLAVRFSVSSGCARRRHLGSVIIFLKV